VVSVAALSVQPRLRGSSRTGVPRDPAVCGHRLMLEAMARLAPSHRRDLEEGEQLGP
jgi:hypothetical protein